MNKKWIGGLALVLALAGGVACGAGGSDDKGKAVSGAAAEAEPGVDEGGDAEATPGIYKFGQTVKFKDGSTLLVGKPVKFKRDQYAGGGEGKKIALKFKSTFKNGTKEIFDPALTSASASAGGTEGESIYQDGLDAPDNKVLPGKSVTWWMGYGLDSQTDLQLEVSIGFLDYGTVIFTN